jgi:penicillin-binding protein 1B
MIRKISFLTLSLVSLSFVICFLYIKSTISLKLPSKDSAKLKEVVLSLEKGGLVDGNLLHNFLIFFKDNPELLKQVIRKNEVIKSFDVKSTATLNTCFKKNCLQRPVKLFEMSPYVWEALINTEDSRFLSHIGLDPVSIIRATLVNIVKGRYAQGASTITQQLVKNIFLTNEKTLWRKFKEALISIYIETLYEKDEIIETYLNNVYWGNFDGVEIKGVEAAANFYFKKKSSNLNLYESLILVAMLKGPIFYHPVKYPERLLSRVSQLTDIFIREKIANKEDKKRLIQDVKGWLGYFKKNKDTIFLHFLTRLKGQKPLVFDDYILFNSAESLSKKLSGALNQSFDFEVFIRKENDTKYIHSFHKEKVKHQLGSILKPIVYSIILKNRELNEKIPLKKLVLSLKSGNWSPRDHLKEGEKSVTIKRAIQRSLNTPLIKLSQEYGFNQLEKELKDFVPTLKVPLSEFPSQLLGSVELDLYELDKLYQKFFKKVCIDKSYNLVYKALTDPSVTTISRRSKELFGLSFFGKTGTSNNSMDNWFVFHGGKETIITWFGYLGSRRKGPFSISGSTTSFEILKSYLLGRGKRVGQFSCD